MIITYVAVVAILLVSAFFSASETAMTAVSRARIYQLVMEGNKRARLVSTMRKNKESLIATVLIGNNIANAAASALITSASIQLFDEGALLIAVGVASVLTVLFAEILPKTYAIQHAERTALALAPIIYFLTIVLAPINRCIHWLVSFTMKAMGIDTGNQSSLVSATDVIRGTIELHHREGKMIKQDRDMLGSILDLNDVELRSILVHRMYVDTVNADQSGDAVIQQAIATMHSRIPLWKGQPDNIIGILHMKDVIKALHSQLSFSIEEVIAMAHAPWFVPDTTSLRDQLLAFRSRKQHFACVVDEYGGWVGIVTLEDIIEEIVGNIEDEHDEISHAHIHKNEDGSHTIDGNVSLRDINRQLDYDLPEDEANTLSGLVLELARSIPPRGFIIEGHGYRFTVMEKHTTHLKRIKLERLQREALDL